MTSRTLASFLEDMDNDVEFAEQQANDKPLRDIAMLLVRVRRELGLTQAEFARRAEVSQGYVSRLESGTANPSIQALSRLLRRNGVTLRFEISTDGQASARDDRAADDSGQDLSTEPVKRDRVLLPA